MKARIHSEAHRYILVAVAIVAVWVRLVLATVNLSANDDHTEVVALILESGTAPGASACHQCYHPKLYYWTGALVLEALGFRDIRSSDDAIRILQGLNVLAGLATLCLAWLYLNSTALFERTRVWVFSLIALNPALVLINCQASNDSFAILFASMAICAYRRACLSRSIGALTLLVAAATLANLSKGTALPITITIAIMIGAWAAGWRKIRGEPARIIALAGFYACMLGSLSMALGPYGRSAEGYKNLTTFNYGRFIPDKGKIFYEGERPMKTGEASYLLWNRFLTLRLVDLLRQPYNYNIIDNVKERPKHMKSLWTQIYGKANSTRFGSWPPEYASIRPVSLWIRRLIFVLALVPLALGIYGAWLAISRLVLWRLSSIGTLAVWPDLLVVLASIASVIYFSLVFRSPLVKAVYLYPALLCYARLLALGMDRFWIRIIRHRRARLAVELALGGLLLLYLADVCDLISGLIHRNIVLATSR